MSIARGRLTGQRRSADIYPFGHTLTAATIARVSPAAQAKVGPLQGHKSSNEWRPNPADDFFQFASGSMLVSPINLKILAYTLDVEGHDSSAALRRIGLPGIDSIKEDGEWVDVGLFDRLMAAAIEVTGDPAFGLIAGKSIALMRYGPITPVILFGSSLRQLLEDVRHFAPLMVEQSEIELVEGKQLARLVVHPLIKGGLSGHFRADLVTMSSMQMLRFASAAAGRDDAIEVELAHTVPQALEERYRAAFGPRLRFNQRQNSVAFDPAVLDLKLLSHDPLGYTAARTRAESALAARLRRSDMAERVRQHLLAAFPGKPSVIDTARSMGLSDRSLRRQLALLGVTHGDLVQECEQLMAQRLLSEGRLTLAEIADALGFSSASSFHRAFKRWTGLTPLDWRDSLRAASAGS